MEGEGERKELPPPGLRPSSRSLSRPPAGLPPAALRPRRRGEGGGGKPRQGRRGSHPRRAAGYSRLTFMLPKAEGCCTGLQLSAKEVVLGRPDMVLPLLLCPDHRSLPAFPPPPPRPGGPVCRSLARSAGGDGRDAPHETPGSPLPPPRGSPLPSRSLSRSAAAAASPSVFLFFLTPPVPHKTILPGSAGGSETCLRPVRSPPGPAPLPLPAASEGGWLGLAAPTPGASHMGRRLTARLL